MSFGIARRTWLVGGLAAAAAALGSAVAWKSAHAQGWGGRFHGGPLGLRAMLHDLDLSADQKKQLAGILRAHKTEILQARDKMAQAGKGVLDALADQDAKPEALQTRVDAVADAGKQAAHVWIAMRKEVLAILTPQQKQDLAKQRQRFVQRMEARMGDRRHDLEQHLDDWIERLGR